MADLIQPLRQAVQNPAPHGVPLEAFRTEAEFELCEDIEFDPETSVDWLAPHCMDNFSWSLRVINMLGDMLWVTKSTKPAVDGPVEY